MRLLRAFLLCLVSVFCISACGSIHKVGQKKDLSPYDFGLIKAKTGIERYEVLLKTHQAAVAAGVNVDYSGIDTIRIEIPPNPKRIPLTRTNDFKGCVLIVKNTSKACWVFENRTRGSNLHIDNRLIDLGDFRTIDSLKKGKFLLIIEDENLWVPNRKDHSYGHSRKDVLLVENGIAKNKVVMPYNNTYSKPKCSVVTLGKSPMVFKNISILRDPGCTFLTHIAIIEGTDDVRFENVRIKTPKSELTDDRGISIYNCTNVKMENVRIDGTYSHLDHSGYGIFLNNVWNYKAKQLYGKANWGIFGNNNVNVARIEDSQINRFDIHCYGRDISFKNVTFFDLYNQYSSVYGTILYENCTFTDFVPVLNGGSYNSFVAHEVVLSDCVINMTPKKNYIFNFYHLNEVKNPRHELSEKCLPNVKIQNLVVNMTGGAENFFMFLFTASSKNVSDISYLSNINIDGLTINQDGDKPIKEILLSNITVNTKQPIDCKLTNIKVNNLSTKALFIDDRSKVRLKANLSLRNGKAILHNAECISQ